MGHVETLVNALEVTNNIMVFLGSANKPRTIKDPFTVDERAELIRKTIPIEKNWSDKRFMQDLSIVPLEDCLYDDNQWAANVRTEVSNRWPFAKNIAIIGHSKDESSYYLKMFLGWTVIEVPNYKGIDATAIRKAFFSKQGYWSSIHKIIPGTTSSFLTKFQTEKKTEFDALCKEYEFIEAYKQLWASSPYPPTFVTVDAVVFYCGHVLMVKRKAEPGKGLWALPGGFIGKNERIKDVGIRELYEETKLGLFPSELVSMYRSSDVFDSPNRSLRGRTITHAFNYSTILPLERLGGKFPKVKGSDDAEVAKWFALSDILRMGHLIFEDHLDLIKAFL